MANTTFLSLNCQGLGDLEKRRDVLNYLRGKKMNIYCLQDTHFTEQIEPYVEAQWGYKCFFNSYKSNARGVAIFFNNNFEVKVHKVEKDGNGNFIIIDLTVEDERITLLNLYAPNKDDPNFFINLFNIIDDIGNEKCIICGDFNLVQDQALDTYNYKNVNNPRSSLKLKELIQSFDLQDPFRATFPTEKKYTWRKKNPLKQARLDFFLISNNLSLFVKNTEFLNSYRSDHSPIVLVLQFKNIKRGKGLWKFNNSLLFDPKYVNIVKKIISDTKIQYALPIYNIDWIPVAPTSDLQFVINDQLFLDVLLMEIRNVTLSFAAKKKKTLKENELKLESEIRLLENLTNPSDLEILEFKNTELIKLRQQKMKGAVIRSKANWIENGEKPSKYFCNLESRNYFNKLMYEIELENGTRITNFDDILSETKNFYEKLYSKKDIALCNFDEKISKNYKKKLTDSEADTLEGEITYSELLQVLKNSKNEKSPGSDGFTIEFLKFFWGDLGYFVLRHINDSYNKKEMSTTQKTGIITLIPKPGKAKQLLKNWRPITLLNCVYKLASGCIASRIKTVLDKLISKDQTGFIKGRFIGENTRLIYDIMNHCEKNKIPGLLLQVDFEKAFDSLSWQFVYQVLDYFNFKNSIKQWVITFYKNQMSYVLQNGNLSQPLLPQRGCRQGDPLSPYIFILCAEILAHLIKSEKDIKGIKINNIEYLISQYADDTTFILDGSPTSFHATMLTLERYAELSGLKINYSKSSVVWVGSKKFSKEVFHHTRWRLEWGVTRFMMLGINFNVNLREMIVENFDSKIDNIKASLNKWAKRKLTPLGRITVLKTIILPRLVHLLTSLPNPPNKMIEELNTRFFKFVWNNKVERVKRKVLIQNQKLGGLKMPNINSVNKALKISWIKRLMSSNSKWTGLFESETKTNFQKITIFGDDYAKSISSMKNDFWRDCLAHWSDLLKVLNKSKINQNDCISLWHNSDLKIGKKSICYDKLVVKGIYYIEDLFDEEQQFLSHETFSKRHDIKINFLNYISLINTVKKYLRLANLTTKDFVHQIGPKIPRCIHLLKKKESVCKLVGTFFCDTHTVPTSQNAYLNKGFHIDNETWKNYYILPFKCTTDTSLQWLQFRILHRILATNSLLCKFKILENNKCTFCNLEKETLEHIFYDCSFVERFFTDVSSWLLTNRNLHITFTKNMIFFGIPHKNDNIAINWFILQCKKYIYSSRSKKKLPNLLEFCKILEYELNIQKYNLLKNCKNNEIEKNWKQWFDSLGHQQE